MEHYDPKRIEKKWQDTWEKDGIYTTSHDADREKLYVLDMFPYPSGDGLHLGHTENYVATDIYSRYFRMKGKNVLHPIGWDAFGLPAENFAIKTGVHPNEKTHENIKNFTRQIHELGTCYDWSREIDTSSPEYYRWTQWWFLFLYNNGWAYKKKAKVNWCDSCKTVLANEQAENGICERCKNEVIQKDLEQWFFKITDFADDLIDDLDTVNWPNSTKTNQRNWIGRSTGVQFDLAVKSSAEKISVYTTRIDTVFGMTYVVLAPESELAETLLKSAENAAEVQAYMDAAAKKTELERTELSKDKTGVEMKGVVAINPFNGKEVPVFVADYVLANYGTGAVMAVPAHDERDFEFAKTYELPIISSVEPELTIDEVEGSVRDLHESILKGETVFTEDGTVIDSGDFTGLSSEQAREKMGEWVEKNKIGIRKTNYRLRDWLVSRQRYWGAPIPVVYDPDGKPHPVPEKHLPWILPTDVEFKPTGTSPLAQSKELQERTEKIFGKGWTPEVDTMDTFVCSSWYYFRYSDPKNTEEFASKDAVRQWMPVDMYMGGAEHTVLHLMYARFFTKALCKKGLIDFNEPFVKLRHQGMILAEDGRKMSKSLGNVVNPDSVIETYGADTLRLHIMFLGPLEDMKPWNPGTILGSRRFIERVWRLHQKVAPEGAPCEKTLHKTIKKVSEDIETLRYNTAISVLMVLSSEMEKEETVSQSSYESLLKLIAPFAPHTAEELWSKLGHETSIHLEEWPTFEPHMIVEDILTLAVQINGKVRDTIEVDAGATEEEIKKVALERQKVKDWLKDKEPKKVIYVKGRLVSVVI